MTEEKTPTQPLDPNRPNRVDPPDGTDRESSVDDRSAELVPEAMQERLASFFAMTHVGPRPDPLMEKVTSAQISKVIGHAEAASQREHDYDLKRESSRRLYAITGVVFILLICLMFLHYDKTEHIDAIVSAAIGLLGGYGLGRYSATH